MRILIVDNPTHAKILGLIIKQQFKTHKHLKVLWESNENEAFYRIDEEKIDIVAIGTEPTMLPQHIRYYDQIQPYLMSYNANDRISDIIENLRKYISAKTKSKH